MAKKSKSSDYTMKSELLTKNEYSYKDVLFMRQTPIKEEYIDRLCADWLQWAQKDTSLRIRQFWNERGMHIGTIYRWMETFPQLKEAHDKVLDMLADRRDIGALTRKYDGAQVRETLAMYDPDFKAFLAWRTQLNKKEESVGSGIITVEVPTFPETDEVPTKVIKDE